MAQGPSAGALAQLWRSVYAKAAEAAEGRARGLLQQHLYAYHLRTGGAAPAGGGWVLVYEHEVTAPAGELTLRLPASGTLPQTHATLVVELRARSTATGTVRDNLTLEVNAQAASTYSYTMTRNDAGTLDAFASTNDSKWDVGACPRAGAAAGSFGYAQVTLPMYARTDTKKGYLAQSQTPSGSGDGAPYLQQSGGWVLGSTAALTALFLRPGFGQFAQGSLVRLWGVTAG